MVVFKIRPGGYLKTTEKVCAKPSAQKMLFAQWLLEKIFIGKHEKTLISNVNKIYFLFTVSLQFNYCVLLALRSYFH